MSINKNVWLLGWVSFFNNIGSEMMKPLLPMFLQELGAAGVAIGFVGGFRDSISKIFTVFFGYLSDKLNERALFVYIGYGLAAVFKFSLAFTHTWLQAGIVSIAERSCKALRSAPRDVMIVDFMPEFKGRGFGIRRTMHDVGGIVGALLVVFLFWQFQWSMRLIFIAAGIITLFSLVPIAFLDRPHVKTHEKHLTVGFAHIPHKLRMFLIVSGVFSAAYVSYMFFLLKTKQYFVGQWGFVIPILLYALYKVFAAFFAYTLGVLADRIGCNAILLIGYLLFTLTCIGFALFEGVGAFMVLFACYGIVKAIMEVCSRVYISNFTPEHMRAMVFGTLFTVEGLVGAPANILAGVLWNYSPSYTFIFCGLASALTAVLFVVLCIVPKKCT
jgi:MFS family permease